MSPLAWALVLIGLLIALSRGPLVFAPGATRALYFRLFESDARMRIFGLAMAPLGAALVWAAAGEAGSAAALVRGLGVLMLVLCLGVFVPFPGPARRLAAKVWGGFGETTMQVLGFAAVVFGIALMAYGFSL